MNYYISDLHFNHENVLRFDNRPFDSINEMELALINNWNSIVTKNDDVYVLGDFCFKNWRYGIEILKKLKGRKHLIKGNHDKINDDVRKYWYEICDYKDLSDNGKRVILSHYPMMFFNGQHNNAIMLYGHVHNSKEWLIIEQWRKNLQQNGIRNDIFNVGCMMPYMEYTPRTLIEILSTANQKIEEFKISKDGDL